MTITLNYLRHEVHKKTAGPTEGRQSKPLVWKSVSMARGAERRAFDPHIRCHKLRTMPKAPLLGSWVGMKRFDQVLNDKPRPAHPTDKLFPAMQEFVSSRFAQATWFCGRQGTRAIIALCQSKATILRANLRLQADR